MHGRRFVGISFLVVFILLAACSDENNAENNGNNEKEETEENEEETSEEPVEMETLDYGDEYGLEVDPPAEEVNTELPVKGTIDETDELADDDVWVHIRKKDNTEEIKDSEFEYYIPVENGQFKDKVNLPNGEGEYKVVVRLPSDEDEDDKYYDAAEFDVKNVDDEIEREVQYEKYGIDRDLQLADDISGWNKADRTFDISGTVGEDYNGERLLVEVGKDTEDHDVVLPIENGKFSGEIPLNHGEGTHQIKVQLEDEDDEKYYDSAELYVMNESDKELTDFDEYEDYIDSGVTLESPAQDVEKVQDEIEYPVQGTIDEDAPLADEINYIVVEMRQTDDHEESTYIIPVEDYEFKQETYFRFGPGDYEVTISIPDPEKEDGAKFHYKNILSLDHEVEDIEDKRDILPSRGTQADDPEIIDKAEELTEGKDDDREKAKAIYEYVAKNIDYDVDKFEEDAFEADDSAIKTLESENGICQDYTFLTVALLRSLDIESHYIEGFAGSDRHAWVEADLDGEEVEMDPTFGAGYVDDDDEFVSDYDEDYFDPDEDLLDETHVREGPMY